MDINTVFLNPQADFSDKNIQPIENKQDFYIAMEKQIDSLNKQSTLSEKENNNFNLEIKSELDDTTQNLEKNSLSSGNKLPTEESIEKNDDAVVIYSAIFNPMICHTDDLELKADYLKSVNIIQEDLKSKTDEEENLPFQNKKEMNINDLSPHNKEIHASTENLGLYQNKIEKSLNSDHKNTDIENDEQSSELTSLIPSDFELENKPRNKIQSQLSTYEKISEFNASSMIENEVIQTETKETINESEINYDSNKAQIFEKELGEHLVSMVKENEHQVKLKINPPELGNIDIDLNWTDEQANVSFYSGNAQVIATIESSITELKNLFSDQNLSLGDVHVFHQDSDENKKHHQDFDDAQKNQNTESNLVKKSKKDSINKPLSSGNISVFV